VPASRHRLPLILAIIGIVPFAAFLKVTLTVQRYLLMGRAERQEAAGRLATEDS
jgi:hypothetical protein